ncbi:MAG TPA: hypothetical protein VGR11_16355, partial [Solirubrobacteraceae bacterium]|nr:hypothetical protein [Solirubrobacteraceae bacterium]
MDAIDQEAGTPVAADSRSTTPRTARQRFGASALYGVLMLAASILGLAKMVVLAKVLGATELGYYGLVPIVLPLGTLVCTLGILAPLGVELSIGFGAGDPAARGLRDRALGLVLVGSTTVAAVSLIAILLTSPGDSATTTALALSMFTVLMNSVFEFYLVVLRARVRLVALGAAYCARSAFALAATAAAASAYGYRGAILAEIAVLVLIVACVVRVLEPATHPRLPLRGEASRLVRVGIPLSFSSLLLIIVVFADRAFVATRLPDQLGQYT